MSSSARLPFSGVFSITKAPSPSAVGQVEITLSRLGGGSHRETWKQVITLINDILSLETGARAMVVLDTLKREIQSPTLLSDLRNEINYDVTLSPHDSSMWSSLLLKIDGPDRLEDELARSTQEKPARRFEVVAMALACLSAQLRMDHLQRGGHLDKRQKKYRESILPGRAWLTVTP